MTVLFGHSQWYAVEPYVRLVWEEANVERILPRGHLEFLAAEVEHIEEVMHDHECPDQPELRNAYQSATGVEPDYLTTVALLNFSKAQAELITLERDVFAVLHQMSPDAYPLESPMVFAVRRAIAEQTAIASGDYADCRNILDTEIQARAVFAINTYRLVNLEPGLTAPDHSAYQNAVGRMEQFRIPLSSIE